MEAAAVVRHRRCFPPSPLHPIRLLLALGPALFAFSTASSAPAQASGPVPLSTLSPPPPPAAAPAQASPPLPPPAQAPVSPAAIPPPPNGTSPKGDQSRPVAPAPAPAKPAESPSITNVSGLPSTAVEASTTVNVSSPSPEASETTSAAPPESWKGAPVVAAGTPPESSRVAPSQTDLSPASQTDPSPPKTWKGAPAGGAPPESSKNALPELSLPEAAEAPRVAGGLPPASVGAPASVSAGLPRENAQAPLEKDPDPSTGVDTAAPAAANAAVGDSPQDDISVPSSAASTVAASNFQEAFSEQSELPPLEDGDDASYAATASALSSGLSNEGPLPPLHVDKEVSSAFESGRGFAPFQEAPTGNTAAPEPPFEEEEEEASFATATNSATFEEASALDPSSNIPNSFDEVNSAASNEGGVGEELMHKLGRASKVAAWRGARARTCANGTVLSASGQCVAGWSIEYCKWVGGNAFIPSSYNYYGFFRLFRLLRIQDAVRPPKGQYALNGVCQKVVDSSCTVKVAGLSCSSCCYTSPEPLKVINSPCFTGSKLCNITYSQFSGQCGAPPTDREDITICNVCHRE